MGVLWSSDHERSAAGKLKNSPNWIRRTVIFDSVIFVFLIASVTSEDSHTVSVSRLIFTNYLLNWKSVTVFSIFVFYDPDLVVNLFVEGLFKDE